MKIRLKEGDAVFIRLGNSDGNVSLFEGVITNCQTEEEMGCIFYRVGIPSLKIIEVRVEEKNIIIPLETLSQIIGRIFQGK